MGENNLFNKVYNHFLQGKKEFKQYSRVERLDYAYNALSFVRDLFCDDHNVDPQKVDVSFAYMPGSSGRNIWKNVENNKVIDTTVALSISNALRLDTTVDGLYKLIFHEMGHAIDSLTRSDFTDENFLLNNLGIDVFQGPGWWGRKDEKIADDFAHEYILKILNKQLSENPNSETLKQIENFEQEYQYKNLMHKKGSEDLAKIVEAKKEGKLILQKENDEQKLDNQNETMVDRMVVPAIRNDNYFVKKIVERESSTGSSQTFGNALLISQDTIKQVANEPEMQQIANTKNFLSLEEEELVSINSSPFNKEENTDEKIEEKPSVEDLAESDKRLPEKIGKEDEQNNGAFPEQIGLEP